MCVRVRVRVRVREGEGRYIKSLKRLPRGIFNCLFSTLDLSHGIRIKKGTCRIGRVRFRQKVVQSAMCVGFFFG